MIRRSGDRTLRRRIGFQRGRRPGQLARKRVLAGGKLAVGRPSESKAGWLAVKREVLVRCRGRCEVCGARVQDPDHVVRRSQGGADHAENIIGLCRPCHRRRDWPYSKGRLVIAALGEGRFLWGLVRAADKWSARTVEVQGTTRGHTRAGPACSAQTSPGSGGASSAGPVGIPERRT